MDAVGRSLRLVVMKYDIEQEFMNTGVSGV